MLQLDPMIDLDTATLSVHNFARFCFLCRFFRPTFRQRLVCPFFFRTSAVLYSCWSLLPRYSPYLVVKKLFEISSVGFWMYLVGFLIEARQSTHMYYIGPSSSKRPPQAGLRLVDYLLPIFVFTSDHIFEYILFVPSGVASTLFVTSSHTSLTWSFFFCIYCSVRFGSLLCFGFGLVGWLWDSAFMTVGFVCFSGVGSIRHLLSFLYAKIDKTWRGWGRVFVCIDAAGQSRRVCMCMYV